MELKDSIPFSQNRIIGPNHDPANTFTVYIFKIRLILFIPISLVEAAIFLTCMREVVCFSLDRDTGYPDQGF
jgi:hypothetical protein